jgi:hypothetical protein
MRHNDGVLSAEFNGDSTRVVTASFDKTVRLWDSETGKALGDPVRHNQLVTSAGFNPGGNEIVTASEDGAVRVWELFDRNEHFHLYAADLAESVGGIRLNERGVPEPVDSDQIEKLRARFSTAGSESTNDPFPGWFLADRSTRTISPSFTISTPSYVQHRIQEGTATSLEDAYRADPGNVLVLISQASQTDDPERALFLCSYAQAHAGNDAEIWSLLAQTLHQNGRTAEGLVAIDRALALQPNETKYSKVRALLMAPGAR